MRLTNLLTSITLLFMFHSGWSQQSTPKAAFLEKWENSSAYLLKIAESLPETVLEFKPTERQMTVKEQLLHIRSNMLWLGNTYFNTNGAGIKNHKDTPASREELLTSLEESFKLVAQLVEQTDENTLEEEVNFFAGPKSRLQILNLLQDHVTHHRGQLIVYLNLLEIEPPRYSGW